MMPQWIQKGVLLAPLTSWQIGGPAEFFCEPHHQDELREAYLWGQAQKLPVTMMGGGSNVLVSDQGVLGLVISTKKLNQLRVEVSQDQLHLYAQCGVKKTELLKQFLKYKLSPALFLAGLPGDVGGGIVMNAGVSEAITPQEFGEIIYSIDVLRPTGEVVTLSHQTLDWSYRQVQGWQPGIIVGAHLVWDMCMDVKILDKVKEANRQRLLKQPLDWPSCGSVFKNPPGLKAAQLIDNCGLKGYSIGGAQVSTKHANFIINQGHASAQDTWKLMNYVKEKVFQQFQVSLHTEVVRIGIW